MPDKPPILTPLCLPTIPAGACSSRCSNKTKTKPHACPVRLTNPMTTPKTTAAPAYLVTENVNAGLAFRWTTSRAADSYGYNICSLMIDGHKVATTCGGGYDMQGTVLGKWINATFPAQLRALADNRIALAEAAGTARYYDGGNGEKIEMDNHTLYLYGVTVWKAEGENMPVEVKCNGGTGLNQMANVLKAFGLRLTSVVRDRRGNTAAYHLTNAK